MVPLNAEVSSDMQELYICYLHVYLRKILFSRNILLCIPYLPAFFAEILSTHFSKSPTVCRKHVSEKCGPLFYLVVAQLVPCVSPQNENEME